MPREKPAELIALFLTGLYVRPLLRATVGTDSRNRLLSLVLVLDAFGFAVVRVRAPVKYYSDFLIKYSNMIRTF